MLRRVKNSQSTSRLNNQHGQALIEYVLILVITVSLILALISQIFEPIQKHLDNYMGKYISCLLEMGELPTLGAEDSPVAEEGGDCNSRFDAASLGAGRPPSSGSGGASSGSGSGSESSSSGGGSGGGGGGGTYAGSSSRGGRSFINSRKGASQGIDGAAPKNEKVVEINLEGGGSSSFFKNSSAGGRRVQGRKTRYIALTGLSDAERKKLEKKADGTASRMVVSEGLAQPPKKTTVKPPQVKNVETAEEPMTIGNFIRIIFIAAIIIALVIFVGGQALQMSKSFEK